MKVDFDSHAGRLSDDGLYGGKFHLGKLEARQCDRSENLSPSLYTIFGNPCAVHLYAPVTGVFTSIWIRFTFYNGAMVALTPKTRGRLIFSKVQNSSKSEAFISLLNSNPRGVLLSKVICLAIQV